MFFESIAELFNTFIFESLLFVFDLFASHDCLYFCLVIITFGFIAKLVRNSISGS